MPNANPVLHHINLKTTRLQEMIDWYGTVVGTTPSFQFPLGAWLSNDGANHRIALLATPGMKDDPDKFAHTGMHHVAFEYDSMDALLATFTRLKGLGILPHMSLDHGLTTSFYYVDPDGNSVELQFDNFGDWAKSKDWMRTSPDFAKNPIGVQVDPDKMIAARAAGASVDDVHRRAYAGEFESRHAARSALANVRGSGNEPLIPAKTGIQKKNWVPASAGTSKRESRAP